MCYTVHIVYVLDVRNTDMSQQTVTLSARVPQDFRNQVDILAKALKRDRAWIVEQAVRRYLTEEVQFIAAVTRGKEDINAGNFISHEAMSDELDRIEAELSPRT